MQFFQLNIQPWLPFKCTMLIVIMCGLITLVTALTAFQMVTKYTESRGVWNANVFYKVTFKAEFIILTKLLRVAKGEL